MYGVPILVKVVPRGSFNPSPNVDSAVLLIDNIKHFGNPKIEKDFFNILHAAFAHKRKLMLGNLKNLSSRLYIKSSNILIGSNLHTARAEDIPIALWQKNDTIISCEQ